ncbi:MAG: hypothetical protein M3296_00970, partial [Actinomycetota bacterium]|nr:hypothetical protein [Actinomycetota bacterium]
SAGTIRGRVAPATGRDWVTLQRRVGHAWMSQFQIPTDVAGRYRATVAQPGRYRVRYRGESGPSVQVG